MTMNKQRKELLLKDLSARLIYGVKICVTYPEIVDYDTNKIKDVTRDKTLDESDMNWLPHGCGKAQAYLRPMSSMTDEEQKEFSDFCVIDELAWKGGDMQGYINQAKIMQTGIDWLNKHHFDYRGLIEKGLALKVSEDLYKSV